MKDIVIFKEKDHIYTFNDEKFQSVSGAFKAVSPQKDWEYIASRKVLKEMIPQKDYKEVTKKVGWESPDLIEHLLPLVDVKKFEKAYAALRQEWKDKNVTATTRGTAFHAKKEAEDLSKDFVVNPVDGLFYAVQKLVKKYDNQSVKDLYELKDGYYPELLVFNKDLKKAGQLDKCFISTKEDGTRIIDIDDWKTDAEILKVPNFRHPRNGYQTLLPPCAHLLETNFNTYMVKISMYALLLELAGFEVRDLRFTSVEIDDDLNILKEVTYKVPYKRWEAAKLLGYGEK